MSGLAVLVDPRRVRILVVGGGEAAARAAGQVASAGGTVRVVGAAPGPELRLLAAQHAGVTLAVREYTPEDVAWATLVYACSDDAALDQRVVDQAQAAGRLVSDGDAGRGTFTTPTSMRVGDVLITVSTADLAPLAQRIRDMVAGRVGVEYARALDGLLGLRNTLRARGAEERWQDAVESLLDEDACAAIERGVFERRLTAWR